MELLLINVRLAALNEKGVFGSVSSAVGEGIASGQEQRMAATSVCVLNEIMYGASGAWNKKLFMDFGDQRLRRDLPGQGVKNPEGKGKIDDQGGQVSKRRSLLSQDLAESESESFTGLLSLQTRWQAAMKEDVMRVMRECTGSILNDYLATEVWDQPSDLASASASAYASKAPMDNNLWPIHAFQDNIMLQKVLVEGVGVLSVALGKEFEDGGFLGIALFPLLEKLACRNYDLRNATAISLNTLCSQCQYSSVRDLVVANVDLVVDSICRQFRHLTTHPNAPNFLAAILRHTDSSADLLPLLEEPLRGVVLELDVLARQNHPQLTVPLLRALREITRATKTEVGVLRSKAVDASAVSELLLEQQRGKEPGAESITESAVEEVVTEFINRRRCRRAVAAIAASCLSACGPLLASKDTQPCLLALDTLEDGIVTLSEAEKAGVHGSKELKHLEELCSAIGHFEASDSLTRPSAGNDENEAKKLLPSMNRVWPHLVFCLRHHNTSVVMRTLAVIASATVECGGTFFTRRFQKDVVPILVKLMRKGSISVPVKNPSRSPGLVLPSSHEGNVLQQNYYNTRGEEAHTAPPAAAAALKVQVTVLKAISTIAANEESASALVGGGSFGRIAAWVVMTACSKGVDTALKEAATKAVLALSQMDPDLMWILIVDLLIHHRASISSSSTSPTAAAAVGVGIASGDRDDESLHSSPSPSGGEAPVGFPSLHDILLPSESAKGGLCAQYALHEVDWSSSLNTRTAQSILANLVDAGD